jgi:DNA-binding MarR family transcriptional regulator
MSEMPDRTRKAAMTILDERPEGEFLSLRDQLSHDIAQVTWGGARQFASALTPFGLTLQQYFTLVAIKRVGECTMGMLAGQTHHSLGTMTGIVDRLVKQEVVARRSHATDRRVVLVQLTERGETILAQVEAMRQEQMDGALERMGEPQARNLIRLLNQYMTAMNISPADVYAGPSAFA